LKEQHLKYTPEMSPIELYETLLEDEPFMSHYQKYKEHTSEESDIHEITEVSCYHQYNQI
jgi:hypothetical protein